MFCIDARRCSNYYIPDSRITFHVLKSPLANVSFAKKIVHVYTLDVSRLMPSSLFIPYTTWARFSVGCTISPLHYCRKGLMPSSLFNPCTTWARFNVGCTISPLHYCRKDLMPSSLFIPSWARFNVGCTISPLHYCRKDLMLCSLFLPYSIVGKI